MFGSAVYSVWTLQVLTTLVMAGVPLGYDCDAAGNHSLPGRECTSYVECLAKEDGRGMVPVERSCSAQMAFSPILRRCVDDALVKGCNRTVRLLDLLEMHDPSLDYMCSDAPNQYVCANCKTLVNCIDGRAYPSRCEVGDFCLSNWDAFGGDVCYPGRPKGCACGETNVFYQDVYDAEAFFKCDESGETDMHYCPVEHWFDATAVECRSSRGLPSCTVPGTFAVHSDCRRYYACIVTRGGGFLQHEFRCPDHDGILFYNEQIGRCDDPCHWKPPEFECSSEGRFADPTDCRRFFVCTWDAESAAFRQVSRQCPEGFEWQQLLRSGVGHCADRGTVPCTSATTSQCILPPGLCS
ncbi:uncharacterized protein [Panulirus ornatus]|uniref:uncharacterized protein n=1 Tax=Panulirus ornatus TaxID=150431 RepID=UPI003A8C132B